MVTHSLASQCRSHIYYCTYTYIYIYIVVTIDNYYGQNDIKVYKSLTDCVYQNIGVKWSAVLGCGGNVGLTPNAILVLLASERSVNIDSTDMPQYWETDCQCTVNSHYCISMGDHGCDFLCV